MTEPASAALYTHKPLGEEIRSVAGYYVLEEEKTLSFRGRELLLVRGSMIVDSSCCGSGGCGFVHVAGYVVGWKTRRSPEGEAVSEVEPVRDEAEREEIRKWVSELERVAQVQFG